MGFLSASSTIVRLHAQAPAKPDRSAMVDAISRHAFKDDEPGLPREEASGWVTIHDPMVTYFDTSDVFFQQYLLVGFRYDKRSVPAKLAWMERRVAERERRERDGVERLTLSIRREIKEEVTDRLMQKALPVPRLFECAWNLDTGIVYFTTRTGTVQEAFQTAFRETFGVAPMPMIPYLTAEHVGLSAKVVDTFRGLEPALLIGNLGTGEDA
ncbi:MAG: recombination-associated protein RdgC [bacterium]